MSFGCSLCNGSGWAAVQDRKTHYLFGFRCHCSLGDRYSAKIPRWSHELKKHYYTATETPERDLKAKAANDNTSEEEIIAPPQPPTNFIEDSPPW